MMRIILLLFDLYYQYKKIL